MMNMPVKVKSNYMSEMKNKLAESNNFEFEVNSAAARLLSATLACSSTIASPDDMSSSEPTYGQTPGKSELVFVEEALSVDAKVVSFACKTNGLAGALACKPAAAPALVPSEASSASRSFASSTQPSHSKQTTNTFPTSPTASSVASSTSSVVTSADGGIQIQTHTHASQQESRQNGCCNHDREIVNVFVEENQLNFDRGKEVPGDTAEVADEATDGHEQVVTMCQNQTCSDRSPANSDSEARTAGDSCIKEVLGCVHYKRKAMFVTPCCNKFYKCRYCHDENEDHHFDRKTLTELICSECDTRQRVQETCENCGVRFGKYTCLICNLFDDDDKAQYHCYGCGICRIGGRKNFFHCEVCNMCLPIQLKIEGHRCVENISRSNCPVCLGDIHTSRIPCHIPDCGHLLHKECFDQLLASGHYVCPTCQTSIIDMTKMWEYLDAQVLIMPVPKSYENRYVNIFCNDCHKTSTVKFHFIGLKCFFCGGYNTTQEAKRRRSWVTVNDNASSA